MIEPVNIEFVTPHKPSSHRLGRTFLVVSLLNVSSLKSMGPSEIICEGASCTGGKTGEDKEEAQPPPKITRGRQQMDR